MKPFLVLFSGLFLGTSLLAQSATVSWGKTYQIIDGFGAGTGYQEMNPNLEPAQADCFFAEQNGACPSGTSIGLEWIRIQDTSIETNTPDLPTLQLAVARGAKVFLSFDREDNFTAAEYPAMAAHMVAKIKYLEANGVPIAAMSPKNEPSNNLSWTATGLATFIVSNLVPEFQAAGMTLPPIVLGESKDWFIEDFVSPCLRDPECSKYVPIVGGHPYYYGPGSQGADGFSKGYNCCVDYAANPVVSSAKGKRIWQTEVEGGFHGPCATDENSASYDSSMADALVYAHNIHDFLTLVGGSAWMFWNLQAETSHPPPDCNDGLTSSKFVPAQRFYAIGNWSKFVRSGWIRIDATAKPVSGVFVTAFKEVSTGKFAIVAINQKSSAENVQFSLSGFPMVSAVTPTVTSASVNLIDQADVAVTKGAFSYALPGKSVVTFRGMAVSPSASVKSDRSSRSKGDGPVANLTK